MMKSTIYLFVLLGIGSIACEDELVEKDVPEAVKSGLTATFPEAAQVEWEKEGEHFEAEFLFNTLEHEALLTAEGEVLKYKHDITEAELPEAVRSSVNQQHAGMIISDPEKLQLQDQVFYQLELEKDKQELKLVYNESGQEQTNLPYWD